MNPNRLTCIFSLLSVITTSAETLAEFTFGDPSNGATLAPDTTTGLTTSNLFISPGLIDGTGFTRAEDAGGSPDGRLIIVDAGEENLQDTITSEDYVQFTINSITTPITINHIGFDARAGGDSGTRVLAIFTSTDGFATPPSPDATLLITPALTNTYTPYGADPEITQSATAVSIRIYAFTGGTTREISIDNLTVRGFLGSPPAELPDLRISVLSPSEIEVRWQATPGVSLQTGTSPDHFTEYTGPAPQSSGPDKFVIDDPTGVPRRFFRLALPNP